MPVQNEAVLRYTIIDKCLTNPYRPYPSMDAIKVALNRAMGQAYSTSTIQKDIKAMKEDEHLGYIAPIKFSKSQNGYYYADENYTIQSFGLNDKELEAIGFAAGILQHFKGIKVNDWYNQAIDKLLSSVDIKKSANEVTLSNAIQPEGLFYMRGMEHFDLFINSIKNKIALSFIHYSYSKKTFKAIVIHPYLLKESNKRWYLVGFSEYHNEIRYFGLDRIYDPILIDKPYIENDKADLKEMFSNKIGLGTIQTEEAVKCENVVLWVSRRMANYIKAMPLHTTQSIKEDGGYGDLVVTLQLFPTVELINMVLSYGSNMVVLQPAWLRKEVALEVQRAFNKYGFQSGRNGKQ
jgi:predicted DNA-binding transcriptional regulator YafY